MRTERLAFLSAVLLAAGCIQGERVIKVNGDGSGTIVDSVKLGERARGMFSAMEAMDKTPAAEKKAKKEAKLKARALEMGPGVAFVSVEQTPEGGEKTLWSFTDISKIKVDSAPSFSDTESHGAGDLTFRFTKEGGNAVLTVLRPAPKPTSGAPAKAKSPEEKAKEIAQMRTLLAGLKIASIVEVNGQLVKATSPWVEGPRVTLIAVDFDQLDEATIQKLQDVSDPSALDAKTLASLKGVKANPGDVVIQFQPR